MLCPNIGTVLPVSKKKPILHAFVAHFMPIFNSKQYLGCVERVTFFFFLDFFSDLTHPLEGVHHEKASDN